MESRHLKGELGMKFQTYAETCQASGRARRGRTFLFMISQQFRLDLNMGSNLTQQALFDLQLEDFTLLGLEKFVARDSSYSSTNRSSKIYLVVVSGQEMSSSSAPY